MLKVKLLHSEARPPTVTYAGSDLGFDLYSIEDVVLPPGVPVKVRTGIAVEGPPGWGFVLGDRSSMASKGVTYAGGRIDAGYRGEILVCLININQPEYSVRALRNGREINLQARCGVLINAGGFSRSREMREEFQAKPNPWRWTNANPGEGIVFGGSRIVIRESTHSTASA